MPKLVLSSAPTKEPISLLEAKVFCRIELEEKSEDDLVNGLITAARQYAEEVTRRAFITQTWKLYLDDWPSGDYISIPLPPLQSVSSIKYTDSDGDVTTWDTSDYIVDTDSEPGRVVLAYGEEWPTDTLYPSNPIEIIFVAGYGDDASDVPRALRQAMFIDIADLYENRESVVIGQTVNHLFGATRLYWPYRIFSF